MTSFLEFSYFFGGGNSLNARESPSSSCLVEFSFILTLFFSAEMPSLVERMFYLVASLMNNVNCCGAQYVTSDGRTPTEENDDLEQKNHRNQQQHDPW